jgi:PAS domain S-box-containing protein
LYPEVAQELALRSGRACFAHPVLILVVATLVPAADQTIALTLACAFAAILMAAGRAVLAWRFAQIHALSPTRWLRLFQAGVYGSAVVWTVFALSVMSAGGDSWPRWIVLVVTSGIAAGATASLCLYPRLLMTSLALMLAPVMGWGLVNGGREGDAVAAIALLFGAGLIGQAGLSADLFRRTANGEKALQASHRRQDSLVESIDGVVWEADRHADRFAFVSKCAESILGYPVEQWLAEPAFWRRHLHPGDAERAISYAAAEKATGRNYSQDYRMLAADGRTVWVHDVVTVVKEGSEIAVCLGVMVDMTARRKAAEESEMLAQALRTVKEAVSIADSEGRVVFVNDSFTKLYGYTRRELASAGINLVRSDKNPPHLDRLIAEETARGGWQGELWNRDKDGNEFPISLSTSVIRGECARAAAMVGVASDISERKQTETEMQRAWHAAEAASRAKSQFLANMSHEIRTPMNGIIGFTQLSLTTGLTEEQRDYLETVEHSAESLMQLLNDVLDAAKIEAGKMELYQAPFSLRECVESSTRTMFAGAQQKGLGLTWEISPQMPDALVGDENRIRQVLLNLVGNAIKFTDRGWVQVRVETAPAPDDAPVAHFTVCDTGPGIPLDKQEIIFERFRQADGSMTRRYGGSGLGLAISAGLVGAMGGRIWVESEAGAGSTFHFTAPLGLAETALRPRAASPCAAGECAPRSILVAEDNAVSQKLLTTLLRERGHEVTVAGNGSVALDLFDKQTFDLILMDIQMPEVDGLQVTAEIRRREEGTGKHIPIVAMTAHAMAGDRERCLESGMDGYMAKPIHPGELMALIAGMTEQTTTAVRSQAAL